MSLKKWKRRMVVEQTEYPDLSLWQAFDLVISVKRPEGLRERTLHDYAKYYRYFAKWISEFHPEIEYVHQLSASTFRDYISYMKFDAMKYADHKFNNKKDHGTGLSDTTVNIRMRGLKVLFSQLERDNLISEDPTANVKMIRQDVDLTNCLTDDEVRAILAQPNQRDFVGFRDYIAIVCMLDC